MQTTTPGSLEATAMVGAFGGSESACAPGPSNLVSGEDDAAEVDEKGSEWEKPKPGTDESQELRWDVRTSAQTCERMWEGQ